MLFLSWTKHWLKLDLDSVTNFVALEIHMPILGVPFFPKDRMDFKVLF